jgi:hypothetical protein
MMTSRKQIYVCWLSVVFILNVCVLISCIIFQSPTREKAISPGIPDVSVDEEEEGEISSEVEEEEKALKYHLQSIRNEK